MTLTAMLRAMSQQKRSILFSVQGGARFPPELWDAFKAKATANNELWIDVLRRLVDHYVNETDRERPPS